MRVVILVLCVFVVGMMVGEGLPGGRFISAHPSYSNNDPETGGHRTGIIIYRKQLIPAISLISYEYNNFLGRSVKLWYPVISNKRQYGIGIENWEEFCPLKHQPRTLDDCAQYITRDEHGVGYLKEKR